MRKSQLIIVAFLLVLLTLGIALLRDSPYTGVSMPAEEERTSLWWQDGFPGLIEGAPWNQTLETGKYGLVFNTEEIAFPHFGALAENATIDELPPAMIDLQLEVEGKTYRCAQGGEWSKFTGPRIVDSGRFFQRFDVTDLTFEAEDQSRLNVEARFELAAWHDRLTMTLSAKPGLESLKAGTAAFGKVNGGFGLDGTNRFDIPQESLSGLTSFTLSFHVFLPDDFKAAEHSPWLLCKSAHEQADGHLGIALDHLGAPRASINLGGGRENATRLTPANRRPLNFNEWNHLILSYDGDHLRFFVNGKLDAAQKFNSTRPLKLSPITFGRRQDGIGDKYSFRGIIDEIQLFEGSIDPSNIIKGTAVQPTAEWKFKANGTGLESPPRETWKNGTAKITLRSGEESLTHQSSLSIDGDETTVALVIDPVSFSAPDAESSITVEATEHSTGEARPVSYEHEPGWHRVNLDGIVPIPPEGEEGPSHDSLERVRLKLSNPEETEQIARLLFEKTRRGFGQRIGTPITGVSVILRNLEGRPTGLPVQLSKNWHVHPSGGTYSGQWLHGISQIRLPPGSETELELTLCYGHWGGVAAASHAQLSLIGWGSNQRWDQSALGSWGESICYEPDQIQGQATITDVRPLMVNPMSDKDEWSWTENVGGGDFFRLFDADGERLPHAAMQASYHRHGPCLTEVTYSGKITEGTSHSITTSLARTDDLVRATYRLRFDATEALPFSRFVIFQVGADSYNKSHEKRFAIGNEEGLLKEWETTVGGNRYQTEPAELVGEIPWVSMHEGAPANSSPPEGAWANRGFVIRSWKAKLGGKDISPWVAEHGMESRGRISSTADLVPPPGVSAFKPGDFVEATIEHLIIPQSTDDYLGPNLELQEALDQHANTWRMVEREAIGNRRVVRSTHGKLKHLYPDIEIKTNQNRARFTLEGGIGYLPLTFSGLSNPDHGTLFINGTTLDQSTHGNDFWQTDYDPQTKTWSRTYNVPGNADAPIEVKFR